MTEALKKSLDSLLSKVDKALDKKGIELNEIRDEQENLPESPLEVMERQLRRESIINQPNTRLIDRISRLQNIRRSIDSWSATIRSDMSEQIPSEQHYFSEAGKDANKFIEEIEGI